MASTRCGARRRVFVFLVRETRQETQDDHQSSVICVHVSAVEVSFRCRMLYRSTKSFLNDSAAPDPGEHSPARAHLTAPSWAGGLAPTSLCRLY